MITVKKTNEKHALLHTHHIFGLQIAPGPCSNENRKRMEERQAVGEEKRFSNPCKRRWRYQKNVWSLRRPHNWFGAKSQTSRGIHAGRSNDIPSPIQWTAIWRSRGACVTTYGWCQLDKREKMPKNKEERLASSEGPQEKDEARMQRKVEKIGMLKKFGQ